MGAADHLSQWARRRVILAEPRLGVLGPVAWAVAVAALATGLTVAVTMRDSVFFLAAMLVLTGLVGFATAPAWMVRVAILGHRRRDRANMEEADALRRHMEEAFVEKRLEEAEFAALDEHLDLVRHGRAPGAVARTAAAYLRGVAWSMAAAGLVVAAAGLVVAYDLEFRETEPGTGQAAWEEDWQGIAWAIVWSSLAAGFGFALVIGAGAAAAGRHGARLLLEDAEQLARARRRLLALRRGP